MSGDEPGEVELIGAPYQEEQHLWWEPHAPIKISKLSAE
jgi:hypothetical protein